jgi:hypothetical protein
MSLAELWRTPNSQIQNRHIRQVIAFAGDGRLLDEGPTSKEFREFLALVPSSVLARYSDECLADSFSESGLALQDIVNEIGRRLGFVVSNGRYRGAGGHVGVDGIWRLPDNRSILVEVKTTDAYRIDLNKIAGYKKRLSKDGLITEEEATSLIVVGRTDTGDLEAQIRGSRHAWETRLISIDALLRLMTIKEEVDDPNTVAKIHEILIPREFTKLDEIVDVLFRTAEEAKEPGTELDSPESKPEGENQGQKKFTPVSFNLACVEKIAAHLNQTLVKRSRITFSSPDDTLTLVCAVSKTHGDLEWPAYWFAFHPHHKETLEKAKAGYVAYGCGSPDLIFLIPFSDFVAWLPGMNVTDSERGTYWHVQIYKETEGYVLARKAGIPRVNLDKYMIKNSK